MAQSSDITSKSLISIAPEDWVEWATRLENIGECEVLNTEFQLISRNTDALVLVKDSSAGRFLTLFEIQSRYFLPEMPLRMTAYVALARAKYKLPVFPILVNILPYGGEIPEKFEVEFLDLTARQDYRVINLWETDAQEILTKNLTALIPFIPTMRGGTDAKLLQKAQMQLELDKELQGTTKLGDLETALRIFAKVILGDKAKDILRWTMIDLIMESPYYKEIQKEGEDRIILMQLSDRFGELDEETKSQIKRLSIEQTENLGRAIFRFNNLDDVKVWLSNQALGLKE